MMQTTPTGLIRGIRRWDLVAFVINSIVGAGIFGLPSKVYSLIGAYSLFAYLACALVIILIILCFAEVSSRFTETGGPYLYAHQAFGSLIGFEVGWLLWLTRLTAFATICNLLILYLAHFLPAANSGPWRAIIIVFIVTSLTIINIIGVRESAIANNVFTVAKLMPLLLFLVVGSFFIDAERYSFVTQPAYGSFSTAVFLLVFAFTGFEVPEITAGEVGNP